MPSSRSSRSGSMESTGRPVKRNVRSAQRREGDFASETLAGVCGAPNPAGNECGKRELVGAKPLRLADARPFGHSKAPLGLSLFRVRSTNANFVCLLYL